MTTATMPVLTEVFEVLGSKVKVEYSIEATIPASKSQVEIYSVNGVPSNFFEEGVLEVIDEQIKIHASNVRKESEESRGEMLSDESRGN